MCLLLVSLWYIGVLLFPIAVDDFLGDCPCYPSDLPVLLSELEDTDPIMSSEISVAISSERLNGFLP